MVGTNSEVKIDAFAATAGAIVLSVALMGHGISVPQKDYPMPKIEGLLSESLRSINQNYVVRTPAIKAAVISGFIEKIATNSRDLEPEVVTVVNRHFWELF